MTTAEDVEAHDDEHSKPVEQTTIFVNNRPVTLPGDHATGAQIKAAAGVPADFKLYDEKGKPIGDDEVVKLKPDERFTAISGQDVS